MVKPAAYFGLLTLVASSVIHGIFFPEVSKNLLIGQACSSHPSTVQYPFLPDWVNAVACTLTTLFMSIHASPDSAPMLGLFGNIFVPATLITTYTSFRPSAQARVMPRLATVFLLLAQFVTAGVALPLYYALYWATSDRPPIASAGDRPKAEYAWTAVLSTIIGMLIPSVIMDSTSWSYGSVALWQAFPIYMLVLNLVLPSLLRGWVGPSLRTPVMIGTVICLIISVREHYGLLFGPTRIADALFPAFRGLGLGKAGHAFFAADCLFAGFTMASAAVLSLRPSRIGLFRAVLLLALGTVLAGPGAAVICAWAWVELYSAANFGEHGA